MLSVNNYSQPYVDECRSKVNVLLPTYNNLVTVVGQQMGAQGTLQPAIESFEPHFFNNMVLA